ncbi:response regulator with CheY-like receiver domain and winged-helix DNA-binding domain [Desulfosporosinus orientis DSM 765]|uniref:Stage 0 sporulation protein A homolog n=1 Tax=Desulfosporosinus orientis (strain ATCC 19365 / DSM 765 / NCIMB 8382 / VKM B-1628 / Singapore I) TaxID=768706 RepID=G7WC13_DESOD|nr:response regulator transcription factor [Desulfosporosinus orientis]AET69987.1 response regulator with CheY-like receiver domain and winged-helix DNA-binding domain [Desulfosporosinus orientis DSM 765]
MKRILIIEDDQNIAELERDYLQLNGYETEIAQDGAQGMKLALTGRFHVVIVDLMLPGKDGYQITKEIRAKFEIPVLIVSAKSEDIDKIRGLGFGADDYLTKPFSPAELVARVKSHISRYERLKGKTTATEIIHCRGLEIDTAAHKVFVNGKEVQMTAREYSLLVFFASNPNIVFSKEHIFETIWGNDYFGDSATVPVHIQKIRKKIERDPSNPEFIETLWGTGYRFNP